MVAQLLQMLKTAIVFVRLRKILSEVAMPSQVLQSVNMFKVFMKEPLVITIIILKVYIVSVLHLQN